MEWHNLHPRGRSRTRIEVGRSYKRLGTTRHSVFFLLESSILDDLQSTVHSSKRRRGHANKSNDGDAEVKDSRARSNTRLISYTGVVTSVCDDASIILDNRIRVMFYHYRRFPSHGRGIRLGATVLVSNAHYIGQGKLKALGCCMYSQVTVTAFSTSLDPFIPIFPTFSPFGALADKMTYADMQGCYNLADALATKFSIYKLSVDAILGSVRRRQAGMLMKILQSAYQKQQQHVGPLARNAQLEALVHSACCELGTPRWQLPTILPLSELLRGTVVMAAQTEAVADGRPWSYRLLSSESFGSRVLLTGRLTCNAMGQLQLCDSTATIDVVIDKAMPEDVGHIWMWDTFEVAVEVFPGGVPSLSLMSGFLPDALRRPQSETDTAAPAENTVLVYVQLRKHAGQVLWRQDKADPKETRGAAVSSSAASLACVISHMGPLTFVEKKTGGTEREQLWRAVAEGYKLDVRGQTSPTLGTEMSHGQQPPLQPLTIECIGSAIQTLAVLRVGEAYVFPNADVSLKSNALIVSLTDDAVTHHNRKEGAALLDRVDLDVKDVLDVLACDWPSNSGETVDDVISFRGIIMSRETRESDNPRRGMQLVNGERDGSRVVLGPSVFLKVKDVHGPHLVSVYLDVFKYAYPMCLLPGAHVTFRRITRKISKTYNIYCTFNPSTHLFIDTHATAVPLSTAAAHSSSMSNYRNRDSADNDVTAESSSELDRVPVRYLMDMINQARLERHVTKVHGAITGVTFAQVSQRCTRCNEVVSGHDSAACVNGCAGAARSIVAELTCIVDDGTAQAQVLVNGAEVWAALRLNKHGIDMIRSAARRLGSVVYYQRVSYFADTDYVDDGDAADSRVLCHFAEHPAVRRPVTLYAVRHFKAPNASGSGAATTTIRINSTTECSTRVPPRLHLRAIKVDERQSVRHSAYALLLQLTSRTGPTTAGKEIS